MLLPFISSADDVVRAEPLPLLNPETTVPSLTARSLVQLCARRPALEFWPISLAQHEAV